MIARFGIAQTRVTAPPSQVEVFSPLEFGPNRYLQLVAGPGYGKTALLTDFLENCGEPSAYALVTAYEPDQYQLVCLLAAAFAHLLSDPEALPLEGGWRPLADSLINQLPDKTCYLVVDDVHHLGETPAAEAFDYLLKFLPSSYRFLLAGRALPDLPSLRRAKLEGQARLLTAQELRFERETLTHLCKGDLELAAHLEALTGGWPLACCYLVQRQDFDWKKGKEDLEEMILLDLWEQLEEELQTFLCVCSTLDFLTPEECDELTERGDSKELLRQFRRQGVFVSEQGGCLRLHPLFQEYLMRRLGSNKELRDQTYRRRSRMLLDQNRLPDAIPYLLGMDSLELATEVIKEQAQQLLRRGRHQLLLDAMGALDTRDDTELLWYQAEAHRQEHEYDKAMEAYERSAELARRSRDSLLESRALTGKAQIYIDTVCPNQASTYLHRAYRVLPPEATPERAQVLNLLAENSVNEGRARAAQRYSRMASQLSDQPGGPRMEARLLLRTGQLRQAWEVVERTLARSQGGPGAAHKDEHLVLSYLASLEGDQQEAERLAREGLDQAQEKGSTLTESVAYMRLGHALGLKQEPEKAAAEECYAKARVLARQTGVARLEAEILMGEALLAAATGEAQSATEASEMALQLTDKAGDAWLSAWIRLTSGIALQTAKSDSAAAQLTQARREMEKCKDQFGQMVAALWQALAAGREVEDDWKRRAQERGYEFLLQRPSLFGPRNPVAALEAGRNLRVSALGPLRVYRDDQELSSKDFKRRKAKELLALFLAHADSPCPRDQLMETLWPEATRKAALRDFRVALHALSHALEPNRPKNTTARPIERREEVYTFLSREVHYDVAEFERLIQLGQRESDPAPFWEHALKLYQGDFLEDYPYLEWCAPHRERLRQLYLETAERLANFYLDREQYEPATELAHAMLARDRCWEEAYRILMRAHLGCERNFMAARVYDQCSEVLREELGVPPSDETEALLAMAT